MRKKLSTILLLLMLLLGLSLLLYPAVSNYINTMLQSDAIYAYNEATAKLSDDDYDTLLEQARAYNEALAENGGGTFTLDEEAQEQYDETLQVADDGLMSYIEIPSIDCTLPIYHGISDEVLQVGVGHLAGSSLPVGGESTHCVLLAHRGLPSAKLFSALDKVLTYEVDQIKIVDPGDVSDLQIESGKDYCTLVTCTPYGVNTHRLLVRGHRIATPEEAQTIRVTADASQIEPMVAAPFAAIPIMVLIMVLLFTGNSRKHHAKRSKQHLIGKEEHDNET
jgi:sortase A